jgi:CspA family cold shock protein
MSSHKEVLPNRLTTSDSGVRALSVDRVPEKAPPATRDVGIDQLIDQLDAARDKQRWQATRAIGLIGSARGDVLYALTNRLNDSCDYVRHGATRSFSRIISNRVVDNSCRDDAKKYKQVAERYGVIDGLLARLNDDFEWVRWQAARALGLLGSARGDVLEALTSRLDDSCKHVRRCAAKSLGDIVALRIDSNRDDGSIVKRYRDAAERYGVVEDLISCLDDDCEEVRQSAQTALLGILSREEVQRVRTSESFEAGGSDDSLSDTEIREGKVYKGEVKGVHDYGALVEIAPGHVGLLHISKIDFSYVQDVSDHFQPGDRIRVKLEKIKAKDKLSLSRKPLIEPNPWDEIGNECEVGETVQGEVVSVKDFGGLVDLEAGVTGLIPVSKLGEGYVDHASEVVSVGQQVEAEILEICAKDERLILRPKQSVPRNKADLKRNDQSSQPNDGKPSKSAQVDGEKLLIDGSNVCRNWPTSDREVSLNVLLTLLLELLSQDFDFECFFDANMPHVLQREAESGAEDAYAHLDGELPARFSEVPGGTDADDPLLQKADARGLRVITNDRFRKEEDREKREKYPWVTHSESQRLIKGSVNGADLQVVQLDIFAKVRTDTRRMVEQIVQDVKNIDRNSSQGKPGQFRGKLKFFDTRKGFGFIEPVGGGDDVFLHANNLSDTTSAKDLQEGQELAFDIEQEKKGPKALEASPLGQ